MIMVSGAQERTPLGGEPVVVPRFDPTRVPTVTAVRGTLLLSAQRALRSKNLFDDYRSHLPRNVHELILAAGAGCWVDMDVAAAHYRAVDALKLPIAAQIALATAASDGMTGMLFAAMARLGRNTGATPWTVIRQARRVWEQLFAGGDICVDGLGAREALISMSGQPLFAIRYFHTAARALVQVGVSVFGASVRIAVHASTETSLSIRAGWV
jgi:hypothetical protein